MKTYEKILCLLQTEMEVPQILGWYHILWIGIVAACLVTLFLLRKKYNEKQVKCVMAIYGIGAFLLELTKQIIWAFNYDAVTGVVTWDYEWYAAPFKLCTTPIDIAIAVLFIKPGKLRHALLSFMAYFTILGSLATILYPSNVFTSMIEVNIHTMYLHMGSLIVSIYLMMVGEVKATKQSYMAGVITFLSFAAVANILNIVIYHSGVLNGESFNMFYISPYFISSLPVFDTIQQSVPYVVYLLAYLVGLSLGGLLIFGIHRLCTRKRVAA